MTPASFKACEITFFSYTHLRGSAGCIDTAHARRWTYARASIWWMIIGLLAKSTIGFGTVSVSGRSLVPNPPTRISALSPGGVPFVATMVSRSFRYVVIDVEYASLVYNESIDRGRQRCYRSLSAASLRLHKGLDVRGKKFEAKTRCDSSECSRRVSKIQFDTASAFIRRPHSDCSCSTSFMPAGMHEASGHQGLGPLQAT